MSENYNVSIIKYSKPKDKKVSVDYKRNISQADFEKMVQRTGEIAMEISLRTVRN